MDRQGEEEDVAVWSESATAKGSARPRGTTVSGMAVPFEPSTLFDVDTESAAMV